MINMIINIRSESDQIGFKS